MVGEICPDKQHKDRDIDDPVDGLGHDVMQGAESCELVEQEWNDGGRGQPLKPAERVIGDDRLSTVE